MRFKFGILLLVAIVISGCNIHQGSVSISSDNIHFSKVTVNGKDIPIRNNIYFSQTEYGKIRIELYHEDDTNPSIIEIFHENNWYKSRIKITEEDRVFQVEYLEDPGLEVEKVAFDIGQTIRLSWL